LLNIDYNIAAQVIANQPKKVLNILINKNQSVCFKGRYLGENVRTLVEIIEYADNNEQSGLIFFSDFSKAFDSLDHIYLFKCLNYCNLENPFINSIKLFKPSHKAVLQILNFLYYFRISKGVRQGCLLSPYLFILAIKLFANAIAKNNNIKGITINNIEIKQTLFADDASFFTDVCPNLL